MSNDNMSMSELVAEIAIQAERTGAEAKTEFKSKAAAKHYLDELTAKPDAGAPFEGGTAVETEASGKPVLIPAGDNSKYATVGKRGPNQGVGAFAKQLIREGKNNAEVLAAVTTQFPTAKTSKACIAYYRAKIVAEQKAAAAAPEVLAAPKVLAAPEVLATAEEPALV